MEQDELIMQAARVLYTASTESALEHHEAANARLVELRMLLINSAPDAEPKEPANPADAPQT